MLISTATWILLTFMSVTVSAGYQLSGRVIRTKYGALRGILLHGNSTRTGSGVRYNTVEAYLGIPYAAPPVGSLRFLPPASPGPWTGIRIANSYGPVCPQQLPNLTNRSAALQFIPHARYYQLRRMQLLLSNQSEDCLYLNVYVPSEASSTTSLAVIVSIHGESYSWGAGQLIDGALLATKSGLIVVTLNYRLGILGFLQTAASPTPGQVRGKSKSTIATQGNYGLLDIIAALLWLKDNLNFFGGDTNRITLIGHGTGAALVNLLMISPLATGLFNQAILMAGSALSPWALVSDARSLKEEVAKQMDCSESQSPDADIGDCLRKKPLASLLGIQLEIPRFWPGFAPFIDGAIIDMDPLMAMQTYSDTFIRYPLMAGITTMESFRYMSDIDLRMGISEDKRDRILRTLVRNTFHYHLSEIFHVLRNEYTDWDRPAFDPLSMRDSLAACLSDGLIVAPLVHVLHLHAARSSSAQNTFFYHFAQIYEDTEYHKRLGSVTGDELEALQLDSTMNGSAPKMIATSNNSSRTNTSMEASFLQYITSFSTTGDPNLEMGPKGELVTRPTLRWEAFNKHSQYYMVLGGRLHIKSHYRGHHMSVWLQLIPQLHQPGSGDVVASHHEFSEVEPNFYEGPVRPAQTGRITTAPTAVTPTAMTECVAHNDTHNISYSRGMDWPPHVMASEEMAGSLNPLLNNNAALSITLTVGIFFLGLNLLLFAAIYRQRALHARKKQEKSQSKEEGIFESTTDLRHYDAENKRKTSYTLETALPLMNGGLPDLGAEGIVDTFEASMIPHPPSPPHKFHYREHFGRRDVNQFMGPLPTNSDTLPRRSGTPAVARKAQIQEITV